MEKIMIFYGIQGNGITFELPLSDFQAIKEHFIDALPAEGIFVRFNRKNDFVKHHAQLEKYIFPALVGLSDESLLRTIRKIEFIKTPEMEVTYTIEQNYEPKSQPVFG